MIKEVTVSLAITPDRVDTRDTRAQLHRVIGQLGGLERMLDDGRPCAEVLVQIQAARGGLNAVSKSLVSAEIRACVDAMDADEAARTMRALDALLAQP